MNIHVLLVSVSLSILPLASIADIAPHKIYEEYNSKVVSGISFEEDKSYYTKRKQDEVDSKIPRYIERLKKPRDEVIAFYLDISMRIAKCKEIILLNETIDGDTATLEYSQKDICGNEPTNQGKQRIKMTKENGWKIDDIVISL